MSTPSFPAEVPEGETDAPTSEKARKKAEAKAEKEAKKAARLAAEEEQRKAAEAILTKTATDIEKEVCGYLPLDFSAKARPTSERKWTRVQELNAELTGQHVWIRGHLQESRIQGALAFLVAREGFATVQMVLDAKVKHEKSTLKWVQHVPDESVIDVYGLVHKPEIEIKGASQQVEIHIEKVFCFSKARELPFVLRDAGKSASAEDAIAVGQDIRLDNRCFDLRTRANQAIFRIQSETCHLFREYLRANSFTEIHTPKLLGGVSEGGANAFTFSYFGRPGCLAQSPQLYKQMALAADMHRVFEIAPVFRAENSNTHRHLCEFVGLDLEMTFYESYHEVLDVLDGLFRHIFEGLGNHCKELVSIVHAQHEARPFEWLPKAPRLTYEEGIEMLRAAGVDGIPEDTSEYDLSTENERRLGQLVYDKYKADFYMLIRYPLGVRPFYTMPDPTDAKWSNSYDLFMRGEEIVSGAQRIHDPELLTERAIKHGIDVKTLQSYVDAFKIGAFPHGGAGVGLERVVMLFLGLNNIRKTSMFPRDPKRLAP